MPFCGASACKGGKPVAGVLTNKEVIDNLEAAFAKLQNAGDCKSLLKKHLTPEIFDKIKGRKTKYESSLLDVIQSGVENLDSGVSLAFSFSVLWLFARDCDCIVDSVLAKMDLWNIPYPSPSATVI